jgi:hypothetical protein
MTKKDKFFIQNSSGYCTTTINYSGYGYGRHCAGKTNLYGYDNNGNAFDYIVTNHRCKVIISMIDSGEWWGLEDSIRSNYSTNGHSTRKGIKKANIERCKLMHRSHQINPLSGKSNHDIRVLLRN